MALAFAKRPGKSGLNLARRTVFDEDKPAVPGVCIRRAIGRAEVLEAYQFLCRSRMALGYPQPEASDFTDFGSGRRETATFIARAWPDVVGTASLLVDSLDEQLPAARTFPELEPLCREGRLVGEVTHRAVLPEYCPPGVPRELLRCCVAHGLFVGCSDVVVVLKPWEGRLFDGLGFERMGTVRSSGGQVPEPVVLERLDLRMLQGEGEAPQGLGDDKMSILHGLYLGGNPYRKHVRAWGDLPQQQAMRMAV